MVTSYRTRTQHENPQPAGKKTTIFVVRQVWLVEDDGHYSASARVDRGPCLTFLFGSARVDLHRPGAP
jgi:hypothetical protein